MVFAVPFDGLHFLREICIGEAVAEGICHLFRIIPAVVAAGVHAGAAARIVDAEHLVVIARFIILIAYVDIFRIDDVLVFVLRVMVGKSEVAEVANRGGGERIGRIGIGEMPGRIRLAREDVRDADEAHVARSAERQAGVYAVLRILDPFDVHREGAVDQNDRLIEFAGALDHPQQVLFFLMEREQRHAVCIGNGIEVDALAAEARKQHDGDVVIFVRIRICQLGGIKILPHFADVGSPRHSRRHPVDAAVLVCVEHGHVHVKPGRLKGAQQRAAARFFERRAAAVGRIYGIFDRIAEQRHAHFVRRQGEGIVLVAQHDGALFHGADIEVVFRLDQLFAVGRIQFAVTARIILRTLAAFDDGRHDAEKGVDKPLVIPAQIGHDEHERKDQAEYSRQAAPKICLGEGSSGFLVFDHDFLLIFFSVSENLTRSLRCRYQET